MKHIAGWFRRNNTIMAQAKEHRRRLQELGELYIKEFDRAIYLREQLHRVARERDNERKLRLEAEDRLLDYHLDKRERKDDPYDELILAVAKKHPGETRHETALRYIMERENQECRVAMSNNKVEQAAEELRDTYLEKQENEEE